MLLFTKHTFLEKSVLKKIIAFFFIIGETLHKEEKIGPNNVYVAQNNVNLGYYSKLLWEPLISSLRGEKRRQ